MSSRRGSQRVESGSPDGRSATCAPSSCRLRTAHNEGDICDEKHPCGCVSASQRLKKSAHDTHCALGVTAENVADKKEDHEADEPSQQHELHHSHIIVIHVDQDVSAGNGHCNVALGTESRVVGARMDLLDCVLCHDCFHVSAHGRVHESVGGVAVELGCWAHN